MKKSLLVMTMIVALALAGTAALAGGQGRGHGPPDASQPSDGVTVVASDDHGDPSPGYADDDNIVDTINLGEGDWKITATGAVEVADTAFAPNCGIVLEDADGKTVLGKQNFADGGFVGRSGFAVTGATQVDGGDVQAHLVCYGAGNDPFEHNIVAVGGN